MSYSLPTTNKKQVGVLKRALAVSARDGVPVYVIERTVGGHLRTFITKDPKLPTRLVKVFPNGKIQYLKEMQERLSGYA